MSAAAVSVMAGSRGGQSSYATAHSGPGSFSTQLKPTTSQDSRLRPDIEPPPGAVVLTKRITGR